MRHLLQVAQAATFAAAYRMPQLAFEPLGCQLAASSAPARSCRRLPRVVLLNRVLLEPEECEVEPGERLVARLDAEDPRATHLRDVLRASDGKRVRAGVVDHGATDNAEVSWLQGDGGRPSLQLDLGRAPPLLAAAPRARVDLILAMPRPLQLARLLPMIGSLGVSTLWLTAAAKVEKSYLSSHMLRDGARGVGKNKGKVRSALLEGVAQAGGTSVPHVVVCRSLPSLLRDEFPAERGDAAEAAVRLACHPDRAAPPGSPLAVSPLSGCLDSRLGAPPLGAGRRVVLAVGPEGGWEEPSELELLARHGFEPVSLGPATLRTDVAVCSLLAVTHERLLAAARGEAVS